MINSTSSPQLHHSHFSRRYLHAVPIRAARNKKGFFGATAVLVWGKWPHIYTFFEESRNSKEGLQSTCFRVTHSEQSARWEALHAFSFRWLLRQPCDLAIPNSPVMAEYGYACNFDSGNTKYRLAVGCLASVGMARTWSLRNGFTDAWFLSKLSWCLECSLLLPDIGNRMICWSQWSGEMGDYTT